MSSPHNYTMKEQGSALGGILKNRKSGTMYDKGRSGMDTVKEQQTHYDDESGYSEYKENNDLNISQNLDASHVTMSMSMKDPSRPPIVVPELAEFLLEEYRKKLGVDTENSKDLLQFWRNYVSLKHKQEREAKRDQNKESMLQAGGYSTLEAGSPKKFKSMVYMPPSNEFQRRGSTAKGKPQLPTDGVMERYRKFGLLYETDVIKTCEIILNEYAETRASQQINFARRQKEKEDTSKKNAQRKKIKEMIDTYYDMQKIKLLEDKIKSIPKAPKKGTKSFKEDKSKSLSKSPKKVQGSPDVQKQQAPPRPGTIIRPQTAKLSKGVPMDTSIPQPPSKLSLEVKRLSEKITDKAALKKIDEQIEPKKQAIMTLMKINHDVQFQKFKSYMNKCELMDRQKQEHFAKRREWEKKNPGQEYPNSLDQAPKDKAPMSLLCEFEPIYNEYQKNKDKKDNNKNLVYDKIPMGDSAVSAMLSEFFQPENIVRRILYYRDHINKSERRGKITLHSFYINTMPEDQQLYMFYVKPVKVQANNETVNVSSDQVAKQYIDDFTWEQDQLAQKDYDAKVKIYQKKEEKYKVQVMKQVFGDKWTPEQGLKTKNDEFKTKAQYTDYLARPKDKWKVGKELKKLAKEFPHDRVIQRMVQEEFKTNQPFMYPEEYDIYDQGDEKTLKTVFANKGERGLQAAPDFEKDQQKWDNFKEKDDPNSRGENFAKNEKAKGEYKLEKELQQYALSYHQLMKTRQTDKEPKTLRSMLAHYYQQIVLKHGIVAKKRFPHTAYGQDPKSETYKKSFPQSFKRYFFKLVKCIIVTVKTDKRTKQKSTVVQYCKKPGSMVMAVGAREPQINDPMDMKSLNTRLQPFSLKMGIGAHKKFEPKAYRSRAWRRNDKKEAMRAIFMQQSEIDNCTFEPKVQTLLKDHGPNIKPEAPIGDFFSNDRLGENLIKRNPKLYKKGILKRARADMTRGDKSFQIILSNLGGAFNLHSVIQYYRPNDTNVWQKGIVAKDSIEKAADKTKLKSRAQNDATKKLNAPPSTSKPETKQPDLSKKSLIENLTAGERAQQFEMTLDQIKDIDQAFQTYATKKNDYKELYLHVRPDLDNAIRKLGFVAGETELNEIENQLNVKQKTEQSDVKILNKKQQDEDRNSQMKRPEVFCRVKGINLNWFTLVMKDRMNELSTTNDLKEAFKILDSIGQQDGSIDAKEFRQVLESIDADFTQNEIDEMIKFADKDGDGTISEGEFVIVMTSGGGKSGKDKGDKGNQKFEVMQKMRLNLKMYLNNRKNQGFYERMKPEIKWILNTVKKQNDEYFTQNRKKKPIEDISEANKSVMDDVWELLQYIIVEQKNKFDKKKMFDMQSKKLKGQLEGYKDQKLNGGPEKGEEGKEDDDDDKDYLKMFKTIMCPLNIKCINRRKQRWPYTSLKNTKKLGQKCPFAHHAMELCFPQTIGVRNKVNQRLLDKCDENPDEAPEEKSKREEFKYSGPLNVCAGHCGRCNMCRYTQLAKISTEGITSMKTTMPMSVDRVDEKVIQNNKDTNNFKTKFGILKKASVLMFYGRPNDCFDALIPAIKIIQDQQKEQNEKNDLIKRKWEQKLGCGDVELAKDYKKIRLEDLNDDLLKNETVDKATMKLYITKICPLIRDIGDRNVFLNGLIEDLYYECEDLLKSMQDGIKKIQKNKDKLEEIKEQLEGLGSDAEKEGIKLEDADGNEIKMKKVRRKMCTSVQRRVDYTQKYLSYKAEPEEKKMKDQKVTLEMKTDKKYYIDTTLNKKKKQDAQGRSTCIVCDKGKDCKDAHTAIELDLLPLDRQIKNLKGAIKAQTTLMMNDRPLQPWRPCASDFKVDEVEFGKKKKKKDKEGEEDDDKKNKKKRLFERENPFDKPWKGDN